MIVVAKVVLWGFDDTRHQARARPADESWETKAQRFATMISTGPREAPVDAVYSRAAVTV